MTDRTVTVRGIPFHYEEVGSGQTVVAIHGLTLDRHVEMAALEPIFSARSDAPGWRRIYPDMPGHGRTPAADWLETEDQMLEVLTEFVDAVAPRERLLLIGISWGAYLAHALATRRADRVGGLMMRVPVVRADRDRRDLPPQTVLVSDPEAVADVRPGEELWPMVAVVQTREMLQRFRALEVEPFDEPFVERLNLNYALSFEDELTTRMEAPALVVTGRQDSIVGYRDAWSLLEHLPRATFAVLDRAGHALDDEQAQLLPMLANEWLDRVLEYLGSQEPR